MSAMNGEGKGLQLNELISKVGKCIYRITMACLIHTLKNIYLEPSVKTFGALL